MSDSPSPATALPQRKTSLLDLDADGLVELAGRMGEPAYRARQMEHWLYRKFVRSSQEMRNLPRPTRDWLERHCTVMPLALEWLVASRDRDTVKVLFRLPDGECIEAVLMLYDRRQTLCISSQAGCAMGCTFCATGLDGLTRNLTPGEIVGQVLFLSRLLAEPGDHGVSLNPSSRRVSNIVFMGMGEPFHNYEAVWSAIRTLVSPDRYGLGARGITVSTIGLPARIEAMADEPLPVNLAVSLHAPHDELRAQIVPPARRWPLGTLLEAVRLYTEKTNRRVSFEYVMLDGINDHPELADQLAHRLRGLLCHINLIPFNPIPGDRYGATPDDRIRQFASRIRKAGLPVSIRLRRGIEMDAGCGQLRAREPNIALSTVGLETGSA